MRKYRIMETDNGYYPQEKKWFKWKFVDHLFGEFTWDKNNKHESKCDSFDYAKRCIERRKEWLVDGGFEPIYHDIQ